MSRRSQFIGAGASAAILGGVLGSPCIAGDAAVLDPFTDGGIVLESAGQTLGSEGPSASIGGWRAFYYLNSHLSGSLTLDENAGTLRLDSTGLGQTTLGYGMRLGPGGNSLQGGTLTALNADLSGYAGLRFHIVENEIINGPTGDFPRMRLQVTLTTGDRGTSGTNVIQGNDIPPTGSVFDLTFEDIPPTSGDGVDLQDVDFIIITVWNGYVGNSVEIGAIELIPAPEPECPIVGDLDCSGAVNVQDMLVLLGQWGACPARGECAADLNGNGAVDVQDLLLLLGNWG